LAGGEGTRLAPLTWALYADRRPKQFAALRGTRSMLQATIDRLLPLVPERRIVVVVTEPCAELALTTVVQPRNRGTSVGLLLPLAHVRLRDPCASVIVTPSDHSVAVPDKLREALEHGIAELDLAPIQIVGVRAESAEPSYGWIVAGSPLGPHVSAAAEFTEKPSPEEAQQLFARGALWNTFVLVADAPTLWNAAARVLPIHAAEIRAAVNAEADEEALERLYAGLTSSDFSRDVLETQPGIAVLPVDGAGWSDWGTPERVFASLSEQERRELVSRTRPADSQLTEPEPAQRLG
jgi:mannose-1-phosphate guanylyltransferase